LGEKLLFLSENLGFLTTNYSAIFGKIWLPVFLPHHFFCHIQVFWLTFLPPGSSDSAGGGGEDDSD
jgi:hypothetical protein